MDRAWPAAFGQARAGGRRGYAEPCHLGGVRRPTFPAAVAWGMREAMDKAVSTSPEKSAAAADLAGLIAEIADGRATALKALYERTSAKLYGIGLRLLGDEGEAQDVLQEVYTLVWTKAGRFDPARAGAITWLATLTRNKAIDRLRARKLPAEELDAASGIADAAPGAFELLERAQDSSRLARCLGELDERARTMIRAAFFEGASYPELAQRQSVPLPTMKSWIRRGLMRLRECLEQ